MTTPICRQLAGAIVVLVMGLLIGFGSTPAAAAPVRYEAEDARIINGVVESNHAGFTGAGFVNTASAVDAGVEFDVRPTTAGSHQLVFRYANGSSTNRPGRVTINGGSATTLSFPPTGAWTTWATQTLTASVSAGSNLVRVAATTADGLGNVDSLTDDGTGGTVPDLSHRLYAVSGTEKALYVYDMDAGHRQLQRVDLPQLSGEVAGLAAHAGTSRLYISYWGTVWNKGHLLAFDLRTNKVLWTKTYEPGVDSVCVTPDGKRLYMGSDERNSSDVFFVLDAATGAIITRIPTALKTHNVICGLDGRRVYMSSVQVPTLFVGDTSTNTVVQRVGPMGGGIRPFTINGSQTLAFLNVNGLLGFEIADLRTGKRIYRVPVPGYSDPNATRNPSHGIALTPDEREVWVADTPNRSVHVFDVTGVPASAPRKVASLRYASRPGWVSVSLDGRFVYPATGDVVQASTRANVARIVATQYQLEIDWSNGVPVRAGSRYGLGYGGAP